jgi:hypothetical protein
MPLVAAAGGTAVARITERRQTADDERRWNRMSHVKHATIGSLVASLMGAALGFLLWARQLDNNGANRGVMRLIGWMGLGLVTVSVAVACLSIAFLQYVMAREREQTGAETGRRSRRRLARTEV